MSSSFVSWSRSESDYEVTRRQFEQVQEDVSVIILGDSHPQKAVMAAEIEGGYNFSSKGENIVLTYYKIKYYLERGDFLPDVAVVPIDLHGFSSFRVDRVIEQDPAFWGQYIEYIDYGMTADKIGSIFGLALNAEFGILGGLGRTVPILVNGVNTVDLVSGFLPAINDYPTQEREERLDWAQERAAFHFDGFSYMDPVLVDYFLRLLDLLDSYDISVVLVYYPVEDLYYQSVGRYAPVDSHLSTVESMVAGTSYDLILDYHDLFFGQQEYFYNADHLNVYGAEIFTNLLVEDLNEAGLPVEAKP